MNPFLLFAFFSIPVLLFSYRSLRKPGSHGFYRFFAFEGMLWLFIANSRYWFYDPFSWHQIISWILLFACIYPAVAGIVILMKSGKPGRQRTDETLLSFEKTTELVQHGIYKYIRHPLYLSLIMLAWALLLKRIDPVLAVVTLAVTFFLYLTARSDEKECLKYFGPDYRNYMTKTRMFVPFVL